MRDSNRQGKPIKQTISLKVYIIYMHERGCSNTTVHPSKVIELAPEQRQHLQFLEIRKN